MCRHLEQWQVIVCVRIHIVSFAAPRREKYNFSLVETICYNWAWVTVRIAVTAFCHIFNSLSVHYMKPIELKSVDNGCSWIVI